jgi:uncharacterized protein YkwD
MKLILISILLLFTATSTYSQRSIRSYSQQKLSLDHLLQSWPEELLDSATVKNNVLFMNQEEKDVVFLCNLARMNGPLFATTILEPYIANENITRDRYVKSLINTLEQQKPLLPLHVDEQLYQLAYDHAKTSGENGTTGHDGFDDRYKIARRNFPMFAENCYYGPISALDIVLVLLIDKGEPDIGHRKNIFNNYYGSGFVGVSIQPHHSVYEYNCVMEFGGKRQQ